MGSRGRWVVGVAAGLVGLAASGFLIVAYAFAPARDFGATSGVVSGVIGALGFAVAVFALLPGLAGPSGDPLEELAAAVAREWEREVMARGLDRSDVLRVRWGSTRRPVVTACGDDSGDVAGMADLWRAHPARQLVVIGDPGAGKSTAAVGLVRRILAERSAGDPVPVLIPLADWDPGADHAEVWLARRLADAYPWLRRRGLASDLVERGRLVPVLDGLDEIGGDRRPAAIPALEAAFGASRPFVLTCRSAEYEELIAVTGSPFAAAAVVEIEAVSAEDAVAYLPSGQVGGAERWKPVLDRLRAEPDGPLATALRTPLMVFLAREGHRRGDPAELLALSDVDVIEETLLDGYIPAVYGDRGPAAPGDRRLDVAEDDARQWLGHFARRSPGPFAWWETAPAMRWTRRLLGAAVGVVVGVVAFAVSGDESIWFAVMPTLVFGAAATGRIHAARPKSLRGSRRVWSTVVWITVADAVLAVALFAFGESELGLAVALIYPGVAVLGVLLASMLTVEPGVSGPERSLRDDRTVAMLTALAYLLLLGGLLVAIGWRGALDTEPLPIVASMPIGTALMGITASAWARFCAARLLLARRRRFPLRLMRFLADAHRRGVVRKVGPRYELRHARLAQHLSSTWVPR
ncbi:hypothetical protein [Phytomonospora endophytica]|uniref:NACHT domain-containing protein n=1 Tax=Phytomonospora endophytica TaxID=714109 RepID=A0A841FU06_9ACTN|nr:hypothetical protein [Phytomonospora endophytica]MBB6036009.1 hypothetical protein [Phytomonospora endophytica]GIG66915.1 hypothetical protein Pen01_32100 [Phytomonospora endophytica]